MGIEDILIVSLLVNVALIFYAVQAHTRWIYWREEWVKEYKRNGESQ